MILAVVAEMFTIHEDINHKENKIEKDDKKEIEEIIANTQN